MTEGSQKLQRARCTFCGEPSRRSDVHPSNPEQLIYSCKASACLNAFRAQLEGVPPDRRERERRGR